MNLLDLVSPIGEPSAKDQSTVFQVLILDIQADAEYRIRLAYAFVSLQDSRHCSL